MNKKMNGLLIVLIILNLALGYNIIKKSEREIVDMSTFTDYYTESESEGGGYVLLDSNFTVYERTYKIIDKNERTKTIYYVVKSGDTLSKISNKFNQSLSVLKFNNPKVGKVLRVGEKLKITPGNTIEYKVGKGDSLSRIATKFGKTVTELKEENHLATTTVKVGQILQINNPKVNLSTVSRSAFDVYWPVAWKGVTSPYGRRYHPVLKRWIGHLGVDLRAHYVPVKAAESGTVTFAGWKSGYGNIVIIKHALGYETRYGHLKTMKVKRGQKVSRGQLIAISGMTGRVTGPHLHFEIRKNGTPQNPMKYFK